MKYMDKINDIINGIENKIKEYLGTIALVIVRALLVGICLYPMLNYLPLQYKVVLIMFYLAFVLLDALRYLIEYQEVVDTEYVDSLEFIVDAYSDIANALLNIIEDDGIEIEGYGDSLIKDIRRVSKDISETIRGDWFMGNSVIDYKDMLFRKLEEGIKLMDRGFDIPKKTYKASEFTHIVGN